MCVMSNWIVLQEWWNKITVFCRVTIAFVWKFNPDAVYGVCDDPDGEVVYCLSWITNYLHEVIRF